MPKMTVDKLLEKKRRGEKLTRVVLWDYPMARLADQAQVDMILVGDSVGMNVLGYPNTIPVTLNEMLHHIKAVSRAVSHCLVVGDLPFMSYEVSIGQAVENAGRIIKEGGADAVKLEGGAHLAETVSAINQAGIPVHGHIGLTPQKIKKLGGFKTQGKNVDAAVEIYRDAVALAEAGCFAITLECVPPVLGAMISRKLESTVVLGVGAGPDCDGQSLNLYDLIGLTPGRVPSFALKHGNVGELVGQSVDAFLDSTRRGLYPAPEHCYPVEEALSREIQQAIENLN